MDFERITDTRHELYKDAAEIYSVSFPFNEQRERESQRRIMRDGEYFFTVMREGKSAKGLVLYWEADSFIYVEHLCIAPSMRGKGLGKSALEFLKEKGKTVILEIDPPTDEISVRRERFYKGSGFVTNGYSHIHPPYHSGYTGHSLAVMSYPKALSEEEYCGFDSYLKNCVMKNPF